MFKGCLINRIVFWEPCTSPHKVDFFAALAACAPHIEVICCVNNGLSEDRIAQGWSINTTDLFRTIVGPSAHEIHELVSDQISSTLHIFSGIRWVPSIVTGIRAVRKYGAKFAIMSEPRVAEGWKGKVRYIQSWLTEGWLRKHTEFVLAQGRNGPPWFISVGYPVERVFPFAYFVNPAEYVVRTPMRAANEVGIIKIGYVGRLVKMKGVFDLVAAMAKLGDKVHLRIVGAGPEENALKLTCAQLNICADFVGILPNNQIGEFMQQLDVLILASTSKDDGWGVVVSEALMVGTAVVATSCVGASIVLDDPLFGRCVSPESPDLIALAVNELYAIEAFKLDKRKKRAELARHCLSAESGARHLIEIIQWRFSVATRPLPFYQMNSCQ